MIRGVLLSVVLWVVASALGWRVDPFLPLVVGFGLRRGWPLWTRIVLGLALAPLAAAATGDLAGERLALYAVAVAGSANLSDWFEDGIRTRMAFVAAAFASTFIARSALAWAGTAPPPAESWSLGLATTGWAAMHAWASLTPIRPPAPPWLPSARANARHHAVAGDPR